MENKYSFLYRIQSSNKPSSISNLMNMPAKRVLISGCGKIEFNPNENKYVYFSKTDKHHVYYIFNKVLKVIINELEHHEKTNAYKALNLPQKVCNKHFIMSANYDIVKRVQDFFKNYIPPMQVELVTLKYLNTMAKFLDKCTIRNTKKQITNAPEYCDTVNYGGGYGINSAWLNLLNCCTKETSSNHLSIDKFFDFLLDNTLRANCVTHSLKGALNKHPEFLKILENQTYTILQNPAITSKNNVNNIVTSVNDIYKNKLINPDSYLTKSDFDKLKKDLKLDIEDLRFEM